jgi:hypothetical protein
MISNDRETATNHTNYQSTVWVDHHITGCSYGYSTGKCSILNVDLKFKMLIKVLYMNLPHILQGTVHSIEKYFSIGACIYIHSTFQKMYFYSHNTDHAICCLSVSLLTVYVRDRQPYTYRHPQKGLWVSGRILDYS